MLDVRTPSVEHRWRTCADRKPGASGTAAASRKSQHRGSARAHGKRFLMFFHFPPQVSSSLITPVHVLLF